MKKGTVISLVVIMLAAGAWYLLRHFTSVLSKNYQYYGYYQDVKGLQASSGVFDKGVKVGKVSAVELEGGEVKVTFSIKKDEKIPEGTAAIITPGDLLGGKAIRLELGSGTRFQKPGSFLKTGADTTFSENFDAKITPIIEDGKLMLRTLDTGLSGFNTLLIGGWGRRTQLDLSKLYKTSETMAKAAVGINNKTVKLTDGIASLDSMTANPGKKNLNINKSITENVDKTDKLVKQDVSKQLTDLGTSINSFSAKIEKISKNTKGIGKLFNDKKPYEGVNQALDTLNSSATELKNNPQGLTIFGGKKKKK